MFLLHQLFSKNMDNYYMFILGKDQNVAVINCPLSNHFDPTALALNYSTKLNLNIMPESLKLAEILVIN